MSREFRQVVWDEQLRADWEQLLRLALREDLADEGDRTTEALLGEALVGEEIRGGARLVAREPGVAAGLPAVESTLRAIDPSLQWLPESRDGESIGSGDCLGRIAGPAAGILAAERLVLNLLGRLSGIATLTRRYVEAVGDTKARIYDTRKTTPGWRRLEKYAVGCGGGRNHRVGLFDAILIKDNHLAVGVETPGGKARYTPAAAVQRARQFAAQCAGGQMVVEIEVDTLEQLEEVLPAGPDVVLLDNMTPEWLRQAVARRDALGPAVELEASGGVTLETVGAIARSGVERISVGALTRSAVCLDLALDWEG